MAPPVISSGGHGARVLDIWFGYRATEFTIPSDWLLPYRSDLDAQHRLGTGAEVGTASGVETFLDFAWADFRTVFRATGVDIESFDELLGCYNLPTDTMPDDMDAQLWHLGWGPPRQVYRWTNALILSYAAYIEEPCTGDEHCDGFGAFVASVLRGETTEKDLLDAGPCQLHFRFMNDDTANAFVAGTTETRETWDCGALDGWTTTCDEGFNVERSLTHAPIVYDKGLLWDAALPPYGFDATANAWIAGNQTSYPSGGEISLPSKVGGGYTAYVFGGSWAVTMRPERLAWYGYLCDYILYLSRMAFDYARDTADGAHPSERADYRRKAVELARYALRILAYRGRTVIHELGHVHNGEGGHCRTGQCCFDLAAFRWECAVSAMLGLPIDPGTSDAAETWTNLGRTIDRYYACDPVGASTTTEPRVHCGIVSPGDPASAWLFWCTNCAGDLGTEAHLSGGTT